MVYSLLWVGQGWCLPIMLGHKSLYSNWLCMSNELLPLCMILADWIASDFTHGAKTGLQMKELGSPNCSRGREIVEIPSHPLMPFLPPPQRNYYKTWKPKARNCPICNNFTWDLGTSLLRLLWTSTLAAGPWPWGALEQLCYPARLPAASVSFLLCVSSPLSPLHCSLPLLSIAGERLCEQRGASLGELFLNPLRESPRVLWCSGFKARDSLHLMWNIQPAGTISQSVHLLPHAAVAVASYLALLWCLPC